MLKYMSGSNPPSTGSPDKPDPDSNDSKAPKGTSAGLAWV